MKKIIERLSPSEEAPKKASLLTPEVMAEVFSLRKPCPNELCHKGEITREEWNEDYKHCKKATEICKYCRGKGYLQLVWA
jgi:hypothetical protein